MSTLVSRCHRKRLLSIVKLRRLKGCLKRLIDPSNILSEVNIVEGGPSRPPHNNKKYDPVVIVKREISK